MFVERLEQRRMLATVSWDAGGDGVSWHDPLNWSTDALPTSADIASLGTAANSVVVSQGAATVLSILGQARLRVTGGSLTTGPGSVSELIVEGGAYTSTSTAASVHAAYRGGRMTGGVKLSSNGTLDLEGGVDPVQFTLMGNAAVTGHLFPGQKIWAQGAATTTITITGDLTVDGEVLFRPFSSGPPVLSIPAGSTVTVTAPGSITFSSAVAGRVSGAGRLINGGALTVSGISSLRVEVECINSGTITAESGSTMTFDVAPITNQGSIYDYGRVIISSEYVMDGGRLFYGVEIRDADIRVLSAAPTAEVITVMGVTRLLSGIPAGVSVIADGDGPSGTAVDAVVTVPQDVEIHGVLGLFGTPRPATLIIPEDITLRVAAEGALQAYETATVTGGGRVESGGAIRTSGRAVAIDVDVESGGTWAVGGSSVVHLKSKQFKTTGTFTAGLSAVIQVWNSATLTTGGSVVLQQAAQLSALADGVLIHEGAMTLSELARASSAGLLVLNGGSVSGAGAMSLAGGRLQVSAPPAQPTSVVISSGWLDSDVPPGLTLLLEGGGGTPTLTLTRDVSNSGVMILSSPASRTVTLELSSGVLLTNTAAGTIKSMHGGGGTRSVTGQGTLRNEGTITVIDGTLAFSANLENFGLVDVQSRLTYTSGTLVNGGVILAGLPLELRGTYVLAGGTITGPHRLIDAVLRTTSSPPAETTLFLEGTCTLLTDLVPLVTLRVGSTGTFNGVLSVVGALTSHGRIILDSNAVRPAGIAIAAGSSLTNAADGTIDASRLTLAGPRSISGGAFTNAGELIVAPGVTLTISSRMTLGPTARLRIQIAGPGQSGQLTYTGAAAVLGGALVPEYTGGYVPQLGARFQPVSSSTLTGQFASLGPAPAEGAKHVAGYSASGVSLLFTSKADIDEDGVTDFSDYLAFLNRYESGDPSVDFSGDGTVDFADYLLFLNYFDQ